MSLPAENYKGNQPEKECSDELNTENKEMPLDPKTPLQVKNSNLIYEHEPWLWYHWVLLVWFCISFGCVLVIHNQRWFSTMVIFSLAFFLAFFKLLTHNTY